MRLISGRTATARAILYTSVSRDGSRTERKQDLNACGEREERGPEHDQRDTPERAFRDERDKDRMNMGATGGGRGGLEELTATPPVKRLVPAGRDRDVGLLV